MKKIIYISANDWDLREKLFSIIDWLKEKGLVDDNCYSKKDIQLIVEVVEE